jgi:hypothetical protein
LGTARDWRPGRYEGCPLEGTGEEEGFFFFDDFWELENSWWFPL